MAKLITLPFEFTANPWDDRVETVCRGWVGTPYVLNRCEKGIGVDCMHYVAACLDELYGVEHSKNLRSLPPDACVHNKLGVVKAGKALLKAYPSHSRVEDWTLESGDLVILGPHSQTPTAAHLLIAGKRGKLWQTNSFGVCFTGYGHDSSEMVVAVYRASDKNLWI